MKCYPVSMAPCLVFMSFLEKPLPQLRQKQICTLHYLVRRYIREENAKPTDFIYHPELNNSTTNIKFTAFAKAPSRILFAHYGRTFSAKLDD